MVGMAFPAGIDMINGRWRGQILYTGVELGVFEHLSGSCGAER
jgi:hypothetical protein